MEYEAHLLKDGTYKSPKNDKIYKTKKAFIAHIHYNGDNFIAARLAQKNKKECKYCDEEYYISGIKAHEKYCLSNPIVRKAKEKICPVCNTTYYKDGATCSYACSNTYFRSGENNGRFKSGSSNYRTICFLHHEKKCIVCGEDKIVAVHHYDHNHKNNDPENLIPLCPTHHQYVHSNYKDEVLYIIEEYVNNRIMDL